MSSPRILTLDIETAPIVSYTWGIWEQNISLDMIKDDWSILCFAAKWLDKKEVIWDYTGARGKDKVREDRRVIECVRKLLDEADIIIAQNGKAFDIKKINARMAVHGMSPYSPVRIVDTLSIAKKYFAFTSNKLAWQSKLLTDTKKDEHKKFPGFELWLECLLDNPKAWLEMKKYNIKDVIATEQLYLKQRAWIDGHPNISTYGAMNDSSACPKCASMKLVKRGYAFTQVGQFQRYQCDGCHGWSTGKVNLLSKDKRKGLLK